MVLVRIYMKHIYKEMKKTPNMLDSKMKMKVKTMMTILHKINWKDRLTTFQTNIIRNT